MLRKKLIKYFFFGHFLGEFICVFWSIYMALCCNAHRMALSMANFDANINENAGSGSISQNSDMDSDSDDFGATVSLSGDKDFSVAAIAGDERASIVRNTGLNSISQTEDNDEDANILKNVISSAGGENDSKMILNAVNIIAKTMRAAGHNKVKQARDNNFEINTYYNKQ